MWNAGDFERRVALREAENEEFAGIVRSMTLRQLEDFKQTVLQEKKTSF